jgi:hypothetical protein
MTAETGTGTTPRSRAAALSADLERRALTLVDQTHRILVADLRAELERRLKTEERPLAALTIYNLINSKQLRLTAGRELERPSA